MRRHLLLVALGLGALLIGMYFPSPWNSPPSTPKPPSTGLTPSLGANGGAGGGWVGGFRSYLPTSLTVSDAHAQTMKTAPRPKAWQDPDGTVHVFVYEELSNGATIERHDKYDEATFSRFAELIIENLKAK